MAFRCIFHGIVYLLRALPSRWTSSIKKKKTKEKKKEKVERKADVPVLRLVVNQPRGTTQGKEIAVVDLVDANIIRYYISICHICVLCVSKISKEVRSREILCELVKPLWSHLRECNKKRFFNNFRLKFISLPFQFTERILVFRCIHTSLYYCKIFLYIK